jgi:hypothetical protein
MVSRANTQSYLEMAGLVNDVIKHLQTQLPVLHLEREYVSASSFPAFEMRKHVQNGLIISYPYLSNILSNMPLHVPQH